MKEQKKQIYTIILIAFALFILLPIRALTANSNDMLQVAEAGVVTITSEHAADEGISSLQFSLTVQPVDPNATVSFQFADTNAKIADYRYHADTGLLNIYLSGTEALFDSSDSLTVGTVIVQNQEGKPVTATVSVQEDSLKYVYGTELKAADNLQISASVVINPAGEVPDDTETPEDTEADDTEETETTENTDDTEDTEDTESTDDTEDTEDTESTDNTQDTEDTESTDDTEDTEDTESTDDTEDTEDTESTDDTDDTEDTESTDNTNDTEDTESTDDTEDTEDAESTDNTEDTEDTESRDDTEVGDTENTDDTKVDDTESTNDTESDDSTNSGNTNHPSTDTGDTLFVLPFLAMLLLSGMGLMLLIFRRRQNNR